MGLEAESRGEWWEMMQGSDHGRALQTLRILFILVKSYQRVFQVGLGNVIMFCVCLLLHHILTICNSQVLSLFIFIDTWGDLCLFLISKQKTLFNVLYTLSMNECLQILCKLFHNPCSFKILSHTVEQYLKSYSYQRLLMLNQFFLCRRNQSVSLSHNKEGTPDLKHQKYSSYDSYSESSRYKNHDRR